MPTNLGFMRFQRHKKIFSVSRFHYKKIDGKVNFAYNGIMQSKAHLRATTKYESKAYEKVSLRIRRDGSNGISREDIQREAEKRGESVNEFIIKAIKERIEA